MKHMTRVSISAMFSRGNRSSLKKRVSAAIGLAILGLLFSFSQVQAQTANDPLTRFLDRLFKKEQTPQAPSKAKRKPTRVQQVPRQPKPATLIVHDAKQKREANTFIAVIGDSLGESLVKGLREAFSSTQEIAIVNRTHADTSLARSRLPDWSFLTRDYTREGVKASQPLTMGVVFVGASPSRILMDDQEEVLIASPRWRELMAERVDSLIRAFAMRGIPLIWVGLPPMKPESHADTVSALNAIYREEVQKAGGTFVDIWASFSNSEKEFIVEGPDVQGQIAQLRSNDGIGLTLAGGRKVAHFVELEIRRLLQARGVSAVISPEASGTGDLNTLIPAASSIKPIAGPILPFSEQAVPEDGEILTQRPILQGRPTSVRYVYEEGRAPEPVAGRADDFSWPTRSYPSSSAD